MASDHVVTDTVDTCTANGVRQACGAEAPARIVSPRPGSTCAAATCSRRVERR